MAVRRVLVYALMTAFLVGAYILFLSSLRRVVFAGVHANNVLVLLATSCLVAGTFGPLRRYVRELIDRLLYRDRYDYAQTLQALGARLASIQPLDEVLSSTADDLTRAMNLTGVAVLLRQPHGTFEVRAASGRCRDPDVAESLAQTAAGRLGSEPAGWWVPLIAHQEVSGLLYVGAKRIPGDFSSKDITLIETLAAQAAVAVANAILVDQLRSKVEDMEIVRDRLLHVQEMERKSLAEAIHDDVVGILLQALGRVEGAAAALPPGSDLQAHLSHAIKLGDYGVHRLREASTQLYPMELKHHGLPAALMRIADEMSRNENVEVSLMDASFPIDHRLPPLVEDALYRLVRQALDNTQRHARAEHAVVELYLGESSVVVRVRDDGEGFAPTCSSVALLRTGHLGLVTMRERIANVGGELIIHSAPGEGTEIEARVPLLTAGVRQLTRQGT